MLVQKNKQAIFLRDDCICPFTATPKEIHNIYKNLGTVMIKAVDCYGKIQYLEFKIGDVDLNSFGVSI